MKTEEHKPEISHLQVREIQAPLISALLKGFIEEIGHDKTFEIASKVIKEDAILSGKKFAEVFSGNSLEVMLRIVQEVWAKDGTMIIENVSIDERTLSFDVTRCLYAELYQKLGIQNLGHLMSCSRDFPFMDGFNPNIRLNRTKTIMEGHPICDFHYSKQ